MKVVLTGITGFVGQNLVPKIIEECQDVEVLTINEKVEEAEILYPYVLYPNFTHISTTELDKLISFNPDIVLHLATITTATNNTEIIKLMIGANIEFGVLLLDALSKCDNFKLFINTGSFAEYRNGADHIDNAYLYSTTKTAFRAFLDYYSSLCGFKYITAIPYTIYGGKMTIKRIMDYIYESLYSVIPIDMTTGEQMLDFTHVDDVASFYIKTINDYSLLLNQEQNGLEFHLGTGIGTTIRQIAGVMEELSRKKCNINWGGRPYRNRDIMYAVAPSNPDFFGWKAGICVKKGILNFLNSNSQNVLF